MTQPKPRIPLDRSRAWDPSDYPHQPSEYHMMPHFRQRMKDPERHLSGEVIARTITCGELKDNEDGCAAFHWMREGDGVEWWFIAGYHEDGYRIAVTAWPYLRDRQAALTNPRWTPAEVNAIEAFNRAKKRRQSLVSSYPQYVRWSKTHPDGRVGGTA